MNTGILMTGVLLLQKSFGRDEKNRLLYQCIPYDKNSSIFLVPYDVKIGFQKMIVNKYVLFSSAGGIKRDIPIGILQQVLGDVSSLTAYYDYLLYSLDLFRNNKWAKQSVLVDIPRDLDLEDGNVENVFTIDNDGTMDYDDAFRFEKFKDGTCCVSVYITDVASLVFTHCRNENMLSIFSGVSTLYLPHRRIPMLLDQISQKVRLVAGSFRHCIAIHFFYDFVSGRFLRGVIDKHVRVLVEKNWNYWEVNSGTETGCGDFFRFTQGLLGGGGKSAKQVVAYWMVQYNRFMSNAFSGACFRRIQQDCLFGVGSGYDWFLYQQEYSLLGSGEKLVYCSGSGGEEKDWIIPMTNPIRRLADLYNQGLFLQVICLDDVKGGSMACFINDKMKSVAKIQRETQLLRFMEKREGTFETDGVVYRIEKKEKGENNRYFVYLNIVGGTGLFSSFKGDYDFTIPFHGRFKLFYFCKNHNVKKKIRVSPCF